MEYGALTHDDNDIILFAGGTQMTGEFESKTHLLAILDNMPFMAWYKDAAGKFVAVNQPFADACGKPKKEIIGGTDFDVWPYELAINYVNDDRDVMRTRAKKTVEEKIDDSAGGVWFETFKTPVFDDRGNVVGTIGMSRDISERMRYRLDLEDRKKFIKSMIDASPDFIFFKNLQFVYLGCNRAFAREFVGRREEDIVGKTDYDFVPYPAMADHFRSRDIEVFVRETTTISEETLTLANGRTIDVETVKTPFYNKQGQMEGLIGIARDITARKKTERMLREQSDYSRLLLQTVPSAVYTIGNDKNITSWNAMAEKITGYTADEVLGRSVSAFSFCPCRDDCDLFSGTVAPCQNLTCKIKNKNGEVRYVLKNVDALRDDRGELIGHIECFDDITEKLLVEEQLKESQMRLSLAITSAGIGMWDWNVPAGTAVFSEHWAGIIGYSLEELHPLGFDIWKSLTHPDDLANTLALLEKCFAGETDLYEREFRMKHKDGHWVWILARGRVVTRDAEGKPLRMVGTHIDITAQKQAEEELRIRERLLTAVALSIKELIDNRDYLAAVARCFELIGPATAANRAFLFATRMDSRGNCFSSQIVRWEAGMTGPQAPNPRMQNIPFEKIDTLIAPLLKGQSYYGLTKDIPEAKTRNQLFKLDVLSMIFLPIFVGDLFWGYVGLDCNYERHWTESEFATFSTFANSLARAIERSLVDNELEAAKQSAEAANELKSQFLANVSHEIRTPMQAILGYSALMKESVGDSRNKSYLDAIQKAGGSLMRLISDILDLSKIEAGKIELQTGDTSVRHIFEDIKDLFSWRLGEKNLRLVIEVDPSVPESVLLDELRTRQILYNLVGNAVKFTDKGLVNVAARAGNFNPRKGTLDLVFTVSDTGIGIPTDQQRAIFEPFKQKDGQSNKKYGGTGLGLSITKRLLEIMGGFIEVQSQPDCGATFVVTLPRVRVGKSDHPLPPPATLALAEETPPPAAPAADASPPPPPEMLAELEKLRRGLWNECSKTNRVNDIRKLAKSIRALGAAHDHTEICCFADALQSSADAFDLKNIKHLLKQFPAILDRLQSGTGKGGE